MDDCVSISEYNPAWQVKFELERARLMDALGEKALEIQHIGSTALPGVAAKDCIDMMVAVHRLDSAEVYACALGHLGYVNENIEDESRLFFHKRDPRSHHVHIVQNDTWHYWRWIVFREYLLEHPESAAWYVELKRYIAGAVSGKREAYTAAKSEFVRFIERKAFAKRPALEIRFKKELASNPTN